MRLCLLASGSNGNACLLEAGGRRLLLDAGIGPIVLTRRLAPLGISPSDLTDVLLTHEHVDHVRGLSGLVKRQPKIRIHATEGTLSSLPAPVRRRAVRIVPGETYPLGRLTLLPFRVRHDAADPVGYRVETPDGALGYATDLGRFDNDVVRGLSGVAALVLEANHCPTMLQRGPYPPYLKQRVAGPDGHLSNSQALALVERLLHPGLGYVALAHLSGVNNRPGEVRRVFAEVLSPLGEDGWEVGRRDGSLPPVTLCPGGRTSSDGSAQLPLPL